MDNVHMIAGVLELVAVAMGLITIRGQAVDRYVCMNSKGHLYPSVSHTVGGHTRGGAV